jgi:hypothetical protein
MLLIFLKVITLFQSYFFLLISFELILFINGVTLVVLKINLENYEYIKK